MRVRIGLSLGVAVALLAAQGAHQPLSAAAGLEPTQQVVVRAGVLTALGPETQDETPAGLRRLGLRVLRVPAGAVGALAAGAGFVQVAQPVHALDVSPNDPGWPAQYGPALIQAPQAWEITTGTLTVTVAIIDSGVDLDHPELAGRIITSTNTISPALTADDVFGHGTHVAGIAAAAGNNGLGIAGIAWGVAIMPIKVLDDNGIGEDTDVAEGIIWAADHGAQVVNLSLGGVCPSPVMDLAVTYAYTMGVTVVAAAGNENKARVLCPAASSHAIAVAAVGPDGQRWALSNYGPEVDLAAPGVGIYSTLPPSLAPSGYGYLTGTSMAAPHVAGAAALLAGRPGFETPDQIRAALETTARDVCPAGPDWAYGAGLVQVRAALDWSGGAAAPLACHYLPSVMLKLPTPYVP